MFNILDKHKRNEFFISSFVIIITLILLIVFFIIMFCLYFPSVKAMEKYVKNIPHVESVKRIYQPGDYNKIADMDIILKNGQEVWCGGIEFYEKGLIFRYAKIKGYESYHCSYNEKTNVYKVEKDGFKDIVNKYIFLDDFLEFAVLICDSNNLNFLDDDTLLNKTSQEIYTSLQDSPYDFSSDGIHYKHFLTYSDVR